MKLLNCNGVSHGFVPLFVQVVILWAYVIRFTYLYMQCMHTR